MQRTFDQIFNPTDADTELNDLVIASGHDERVTRFLDPDTLNTACHDCLYEWAKEPDGPFADYWWKRACAYQAAAFLRLRDRGSHPGFCPYNDMFYWRFAEDNVKFKCHLTPPGRQSN